MYSLNAAVTQSSAAPIPLIKQSTDRYLASAKAKDKPLINLAPGHPAHAPHEQVLKRASITAGDADAYHYGLGKGQQALREAVICEMKDLYRDLDDSSLGDTVNLELEHVTITSGANQAFYVTAQCLAQQGDQIILPTPWFFNHEMACRQLGIEAIPLPCNPDQGFLPDAQAAEKIITSKTKAIVLCTPNNPTGACYPSTTLEAFAALAIKYKIALIVDETYRDLLPSNWEGEDAKIGRRPRPHSLFGKNVQEMLGCHWSEYLVHLYSFSKSHSVCGARLGALVASPTLMEQADKIIDTVTICPEQIAQPALAWSIPNTKVWREETRASINLLNQTFCDSITSIDEGWIVGSAGSFYAFVKHPFEGQSSKDVPMKMIQEAGVSCLPGCFFLPLEEEGKAGDRWLRFSVPNVSIEQLKQVGERLKGLKMA